MYLKEIKWNIDLNFNEFFGSLESLHRISPTSVSPTKFRINSTLESHKILGI